MTKWKCNGCGQESDQRDVYVTCIKNDGCQKEQIHLICNGNLKIFFTIMKTDPMGEVQPLAKSCHWIEHMRWLTWSVKGLMIETKK